MKEVPHTEVLRRFDELQVDLREWWEKSTQGEKSALRLQIDGFRAFGEAHGVVGKNAVLASDFALLGMYACYVWYDPEFGEKVRDGG